MAVLPYKPRLVGEPLQQITRGTESNESDTSLFGDVGELPTTSAESMNLSTNTRFPQSTASSGGMCASSNSTLATMFLEDTGDNVKSLSWEPTSIERAWTDPIVRPKSAASGLRSLPNDVILADDVKALSSHTMDAVCGSAESDASYAGSTQTEPKGKPCNAHVTMLECSV